MTENKQSKDSSRDFVIKALLLIGPFITFFLGLAVLWWSSTLVSETILRGIY